jgi:hypothetical protein
MTLKKQKFRNFDRERRVKVGFNSEEFNELQLASQSENLSMSDFLRSLFLADSKPKSKSAESFSQKSIENNFDLLNSRISNIEKVLRIIVTNTAIARGHASGVLEISTQEVHDVLHNRMIEAREQQKKLFFDLFPHLREANT